MPPDPRIVHHVAMGGAPRHARTPARPHKRREPGLDGLRGVAIALVLAFHGGVGVVGGALGVDVFLVLSGYLITALLLAELDATGRVDLGTFWSRRLRRLLPAVLVLTAVVVAVARPDPLDAISTLGWWSNWRFIAAEQAYFDSFAAPSPLRHSWSLAVEEQWYLLWPPLLVLLHRTRWLLAGIVALAVASAVAMAVSAADVDRAHFGTDTRAQGLLVGAALAVVLARRPAGSWARRTRWAATAAGVAGAIGLALMAWRTPGTAPWLYRGGHLVAAVAAAAVLAAAVLPGGPIRWALSSRPLRAVGRVSYGAYLWHWPTFVWLTPDRTGLDRWPLFAVRLAVTAALAVASWRLVERPVLDAPTPLPRRRIAVATAFAASLAVLVAVGLVAGPASTSGSALARGAAVPTLPVGFVADTVVTTSTAPSTTVADVDVPDVPGVLDTPPVPSPPHPGEPMVTVVGDSSAWALAWAVEPVPGVAVQAGGTIGCGLDPAAIVFEGVARTITGQPVPCSQAADLWRWWAASTDPDVVVLGLGAWEVYDRELPDGERLAVGTDAWARWVDAGLERLVTDLAGAAPRAVIAVADVPCYTEHNHALGGPTSPRNDPARVAAVDDVVAAFVARHPARVVTMPWSTWLCGEEPAERPDGVHLAPDSARALWAGPLGEWVRGLRTTAPA